MSRVIPHHKVDILYFIEDGVPCWTLDLDEVETCKRRGYPYRVVSYTMTTATEKEERHEDPEAELVSRR
jgi:hypothetical protein